MENSSLSVYLVASIVAWLAAQGIKVLLSFIKGTGDLSMFVKSGSMPSSHTAITVALLTTIGVVEGLGSALFAVVTVFTIITVYDAINVRRAVGEQGLVLQELAAASKRKHGFYTANGHTIADVSVGALIGVVSAWIMLQIL